MKVSSLPKDRKEPADMNQKIFEIAETWGADFTGIANLSSAHDFIQQQGGDLVASYPLAISVGISMQHTIVDQLPDRANRSVALSYQYHSYDLINQRLDLLISHVSKYIQREGYNALPIPASERVDDERICAIFSHKIAANLAGLGWIGKSCLLITPEVGPRARWATILTDAPLQVTGKPMEERCGSCTKCVEICPVHALTGIPFNSADPREKRYDAAKCDRYYASMRKESPEQLGVCGLCLYACPHGKHNKNQGPILRKI